MSKKRSMFLLLAVGKHENFLLSTPKHAIASASNVISLSKLRQLTGAKFPPAKYTVKCAFDDR